MQPSEAVRRADGGVVEVLGQLVVVVTVGLFASLWFTAWSWSRTAKRRDAERVARFRRSRSRIRR